MAADARRLGYSPLDQIDRGNVGDLRMVWSRALAQGAQRGTPIAYGGTLYMPNPNDVIQALDAVTGDLRWEYRRDGRRSQTATARGRYSRLRWARRAWGSTQTKLGSRICGSTEGGMRYTNGSLRIVIVSKSR